ncbi:hypothetical protein ACFV5J_35040 [Streptomyces zaomyceticus]|uniref:hypothetical protein n=1 Tax=Streptomyces zaomyceticus TaxID=68286 RepID=UPI001677A507|nr:hypothetical protein [Streptomyces zaomyceticus]GHG29615.1 hypothetical protein GCM10018791_52440 [Streptomyces zaomyceticus]
MGLFSRKSNDTPANPQMAELGREYAIAKRHGDRKTVGRITRQLGTTPVSDADRASFQQGRDAYDAIPPIRNRRKGR